MGIENGNLREAFVYGGVKDGSSVFILLEFLLSVYLYVWEVLVNRGLIVVINIVSC